MKAREIQAVRRAATRLAYDYAVEAQNLRCTDPVTAAVLRREASSIVDDLGLRTPNETRRSDQAMPTVKLKRQSIPAERPRQEADPMSKPGTDRRPKRRGDDVSERELRHLLGLMSAMHCKLNQRASKELQMGRRWPAVLAIALFISAGATTFAVRSGFWMQIEPQVEAVIASFTHTLK